VKRSLQGCYTEVRRSAVSTRYEQVSNSICPLHTLCKRICHM